MAHQLRCYQYKICDILDASPDHTLLSLTISLHCEGIIDRSTKQSVIRKKGFSGADELMSVVTTVVHNEPFKLGMVLDCMENVDVLEHIVKSIHTAAMVCDSAANSTEKCVLPNDEINFKDKDESIEEGDSFLLSANQKQERHVSQTNNNGLTIEEPFYRLAKFHLNSPEAQPGKEETKKREDLQKFCQQVDIIVQTVNDNEKWAVLKYMEPPEIEPGKLLADKPIDLHEPNWIILGMFGGYKCAMIQTEMGVDCRCEVKEALEELPQAKVLMAIGVAYAINSNKVKFGDVLVSKVIHGIGNIKYTKNGSNISRISFTRLRHVSLKLKHVFARGIESWKGFKCSEEGRLSIVHTGRLISNRALINNQEVRDKIASNTPKAIGGEMEGVTLVEIQQSLAKGNKSTPPRALDIIIIKGAADFADGNKNEKWQFTAALAAADYAYHKLKGTDENLFIDHTSYSCYNSFVKLISFNGIIVAIIVLLIGIFLGMILM